MNGECLMENMIYQATVNCKKGQKTYTVLTENFKARYRNHTIFF